MSPRISRILCLGFSAVCGLFGICFLGGGIWLLSVGGSPYYLIAGLALLAVGVLLFLRSPWALLVYAAVVLGSMLWALWEVGLDWWQLVPRGDFIVILGVLLALPWVAVGSKSANGNNRTVFKLGWASLVASIVLSGIVGALALLFSSHDLSGTLPDRTSAASFTPQPSLGAGEWVAYGGTQAGQRYSPLKQITPKNVNQLQVAWTYHTGDIRGPSDPVETTYEVTPLKVGGTVYLCTPHDLVIALDAETGAEKWRFDPKIKEPNAADTQHLTCRGVSYFDGSAVTAAVPTTTPAPTKTACDRRLFLPTADGRLIALSADTGTVCPGFGSDNGTVDLWRNMPNVDRKSVV